MLEPEHTMPDAYRMCQTKTVLKRNLEILPASMPGFRKVAQTGPLSFYRRVAGP